MAELKGTKTEKNLMEAFAGESMARNKYTYFASKAKKDGYQQIAAIFEETAANEKEHAKLWFKLLCGGAIPSTEENLVLAAAGENEEWTDMYARMAEEADAEGFADIAQLFRSVLSKAAPRRLAQKKHTVSAQLFVSDRLLIIAPIDSGDLCFGKQPVLHEHIEIDTIRIAGKA